ncbi:hypothetical protein ACF0H5_014697 [Mactra antiquata]
MAGGVNISTVAGVSVATALVGLIIGVVVTTIVLIRSRTLYMRLQNLLKMTKSDAYQTYTKHGINTTSMELSSYSEIDDTKRNSHLGLVEFQQHSKPQKYTEDTVQYEEYEEKQYTYLSSGLRTSQNCYENIVLHTSCDNKPGTRISESTTEYIIEPGTNKRLSVKIVDKENLPANEDHVYFKLEPGSDRVVPVSRNDISSKQEAAGSRMSDPHTYFILQKPDNVQNSEEMNSYFTDSGNKELNYFILEQST